MKKNFYSILLFIIIEKFKMFFNLDQNDFLGTNNKYKEALKYYGYPEGMPLTAAEIEKNSFIYPMPVLKNSRTLMKQASLPRLFQ
jgi:hypothetical protein